MHTERNDEMNLTYDNTASWIDTVWAALEKLPQDALSDDQRDDLNTAMAWLSESLGVPTVDELEEQQADHMRSLGFEVSEDGSRWVKVPS